MFDLTSEIAEGERKFQAAVCAYPTLAQYAVAQEEWHVWIEEHFPALLAAAKQRDELAAAFAAYGDHLTDCASRKGNTIPCDCGYDEDANVPINALNRYDRERDAALIERILDCDQHHWLYYAKQFWISTEKLRELCDRALKGEL